MIVHALIGPSGTGKSHHAPLFAYNHNINVIVDDGLLINNNQVIAGVSAKRERTRFGAVKRAILKNTEHAESLREKIREINPDRILILGTSQKMAQRIAERLELPHPHQYTFINDLIPQENINKALEIRETQNQHVIPIPTFAIKKDFPGYLIAPLRSFYSRAAAEHKKVALDRTLIRPIYSSMGDFFINEDVIKHLCLYIGDNIPGVHQANKVDIYSDDSGVTMELQLTVIYGYNLKELLFKVQKEVKEKIEYFTGFYLKNVYVIARHLHVPKDKMPAKIEAPQQEKSYSLKQSLTDSWHNQKKKQEHVLDPEREQEQNQNQNQQHDRERIRKFKYSRLNEYALKDTRDDERKQAQKKGHRLVEAQAQAQAQVKEQAQNQEQEYFQPQEPEIKPIYPAHSKK